MVSPEHPDSDRPRGLSRARGTMPLDGYASGSAGADAVVRREDLAREIAQGEKLIAALAPRLSALERALAASGPLNRPLDELFAGVSPNERNFTMQLSRVLADRGEVCRKAQIVLQQFQGASQGLKEAQEVHAQFLAGQLELGRIEGFSLSKFKGSLYPLYNFAKVFAGLPMLEQLFPAIAPPAATRSLAAGPDRVTQPLRPDEDPLGKLSKLVKETPQLASIEPLLDKGLDFLRRAQEAAPELKARSNGFLERMQKAAPGLLSRVTGQAQPTEPGPPGQPEAKPAED